MTTNRKPLLLAFDIRPHWLGFAAFEHRKTLADFGVRRFGPIETGKRHLRSLLQLRRPTGIVIRGIQPGSSRDLPRTRFLQEYLRRLARWSSLDICSISGDDLRAHFKTHGAGTKQEIAHMLARKFPELRWKLPPQRKTWHHEHVNMPIFDAASLALCCLETRNGWPESTATGLMP